MKILAASDIHLFREKENIEYFRTFAEYAKSSNADLIALAGDIVEYPGKSPLESREFQMLFSGMMQVSASEIERRKKHKKIELSPFEQFSVMPIIAEEICRKSIYSAELKEMAGRYLAFIKEAEWQMRNAYGIAKHILKSTGKQVLAIGGNHDLNLEETVMRENNIHRQTRTINRFKISGYGGAARSDGMPLPKGCPPELTTPFNEYPKGGIIEGVTGLVSEPKEFLEQEQPDIAFLHPPLLGLIDIPFKFRGQNIPEAHFGSKGIREYAESGKTRMFLHGHVHDGAGIAKLETSNGELAVAVNLGCLGNTDVVGGYFVELDIDDNTKEFNSATFYQIARPGANPIIHTLKRFFRKGKGNIATIDEIVIPNQVIGDEWKPTIMNEIGERLEKNEK